MANFDWDRFFDGCVARDFGKFSNKLVWVYDYQPENEAVSKHGYVHVMHKQFFSSKAANGLPEYAPAIPAPTWHEGVAPYIVDPAGEQFMLKVPKLECDPGRECWLSPAFPDEQTTDQHDASNAGEQAGTNPARRLKRRKKTKQDWGCDRVFEDVMKTANVHGFPPVIKDQWRALKHLNVQYATRDLLPCVPFSITPGPGEAETQPASFMIEGQPVAWTELWRPLLHRFPRRHQQRTSNVGASSDNVTADDDHGRDVSGMSGEQGAPSKKARRPIVSAATLAAHNGVTSLNRPPVELERAKRVVRREQAVDALPDVVTSVHKDRLYFVRTTVNEGEFQMGLALALTNSEEDGGASPASVKFQWFARAKWIRGKHHRWDDTPAFVVAGFHTIPSTHRLEHTESSRCCDHTILFTLSTLHR